MALTPKTLFKIGGAKPGLWIYQSSTDAAAVVAGSGYFNGAVDSLKQSDVVIVVSGPPLTAVVDVMCVTSADGATPVTLSSTEGVTATLAADEEAARSSKELLLGQKLLAEAGSRAAAVNRVSPNVDDPIKEQLEAEEQEAELRKDAAVKAMELAEGEGNDRPTRDKRYEQSLRERERDQPKDGGPDVVKASPSDKKKAKDD